MALGVEGGVAMKITIQITVGSDLSSFDGRSEENIQMLLPADQRKNHLCNALRWRARDFRLWRLRRPTRWLDEACPWRCSMYGESTVSDGVQTMARRDLGIHGWP